jgi:hypothetical protein
VFRRYWVRCPHEFLGLWLGHEALHLASASDGAARRRVHLLGGASHVSVHWTQLPGAWGCLSRATLGLRRSGRLRRLVAAVLAVAGTTALSRRTSLAALVVWLFNVWGAADFLFAFYQEVFGVELDVRMLGAAFFIPTAVVPPLLITHGLIFWLLIRPRQ